MKKETLGEKIAKYVLFGSLTIGISSGMYLGGRQIYHQQTADKIVTQRSSTKLPSGRILCGFDRDKDGEIDQIIEYFTYWGAKAVTSVERNYTASDEKFSGLKNILDK